MPQRSAFLNRPLLTYCNTISVLLFVCLFVLLEITVGFIFQNSRMYHRKDGLSLNYELSAVSGSLPRHTLSFLVIFLLIQTCGGKWHPNTPVTTLCVCVFAFIRWRTAEVTGCPVAWSNLKNDFKFKQNPKLSSAQLRVETGWCQACAGPQDYRVNSNSTNCTIVHLNINIFLSYFAVYIMYSTLL